MLALKEPAGILRKTCVDGEKVKTLIDVVVAWWEYIEMAIWPRQGKRQNFLSCAKRTSHPQQRTAGEPNQQRIPAIDMAGNTSTADLPRPNQPICDTLFTLTLHIDTTFYIPLSPSPMPYSARSTLPKFCHFNTWAIFFSLTGSCFSAVTKKKLNPTNYSH